MKPFQQLLVAPAALGLLAPMAVNAADLNLNDVKAYSSDSSADQVTSINQFSDVKPTDWAFQALSNLIERYGCVAGYPNGTFKGGQAMTRYEAAALLNACLDRITEVTDELKKLMQEFEKELALIRGRVDGLEARVGELEASQFSTTTKLSGMAMFVMGANSYGGNFVTTPIASAYGGIPVGDKYAKGARQAFGATTFNYDLRLILDTSFTGKDLLRTRLRAGNFKQSAYFGNPPVGLSAMETAFEETCGGKSDCQNMVTVNRLYYQFPIGGAFTATIGGRVRQDDMLAMWPSAYPADTVLDVFTYGGAPGTYNLNLGAGGGLWWKSGGFSLSAAYVSANGDNAQPNSTFVNSGGGIGNSASAQTGTFQLAYGGANFGLAAAYNYANPQGGQAGTYGGNATPLTNTIQALATTVNSVGISGYWQPLTASWFPSISAGWGINNYVGHYTLDSGYGYKLNGAKSQSWYVGVQWADFLMKGNAFGMAVGQPTFITQMPSGITLPDGSTYSSNARDGQYAWEWWYKFQVTDNISVTPALYYLSAPLGQFQRPASGGSDTFNNFGGLVKTTFKF